MRTLAVAIRNPLCPALSSHAPVGGSLLDAPLLHTPCQNACHCEGVPRPWGAIRAPPVADEAGKSPKRCLRQNKRGDFEEVPRLAAATVAGNRLARRWAGASGRGQNWGRPPEGGAEILSAATGTSAIPLHRTLVLPTAGHFLPTAAESAQRTPSKPMVLKSFARLGCRPRGSLLPREPDAQVYHLAFVSSLRLQPLAAHADPRCPVISGMPPASTAQTKNPPHLLPCTRRGDPRGRPRSAHLVALP